MSSGAMRGASACQRFRHIELADMAMYLLSCLKALGMLETNRLLLKDMALQ
jgi:hypothetical protein